MFVGLLMTIIGFAIINRFIKADVFFKIGAGFLLGFGLMTLPLFLLTYFHVPIANGNILFTLIGLSFLALILLSQSKKEDYQINLPKFNIIQWTMAAIIGVFILVIFFINSYWPVTAWDSITLYDFRAHLYSNGGLLTDLWPNLNYIANQVSYYYSYPPLTSLAHTISYLLKDNPSIIYSYFYLSLISIFFSQVYRKSNLSTALVLTLLLATNFTIFSHSLLAYTNIPYATYLVAAYFSLERFTEDKKTYLFVLGCILSGLTIFIRQVEFFPFLLVLLFIPLVFKKRKDIVYPLILIMATLAMRSFAYSHFKKDLMQFGGKVIDQRTSLGLSKIIISLFDFSKYDQIFNYVFSSLDRYYYHLLFLVVSLIIFGSKNIYKNWVLLSFMILTVISIIPGTLVLSLTYEGWDRIPDSINRLMFFIYPLFLYYLANISEVKQILGFLDRENSKKTKV